MIAALPMYDGAATAAANDRLWAGIRRTLGYGPPRLRRTHDLWPLWRAPDLLLAQCCGLPFRSSLYPGVALVAAPDHRLPGCPPGYYRSVLVVQAGSPWKTLSDLDGARLAVNDPQSQSGWAAPLTEAAERGIAFSETITGSHRASAEAVAEGRADLAAIDAVSWKIMERDCSAVSALHVLGHTRPTPALPYITADPRRAPALARALAAAVSGLCPADRALLQLRGIVPLPARAYLAVPTPPGHHPRPRR